MAIRKKGYLGNPNLKQRNELIDWEPNMVKEYVKCSKDPIYFLENYGKIISLDEGIVPFKLYPYQKRIVRGLQNNRKVIGKVGRQLGKSTVVAGFIAWYVLFQEQKNCAILANKMSTAKEIFSKVQLLIELCPKWLQQGVLEWNKTSFVLENGSRCFASSTSPSAIRGFSLNFLLLDEFGIIPSNLAEEFITAVIPTISSGKDSKIAIVSTPKGMNHFYKIWTEAGEEGEKSLNGFVRISANWKEHPKRNQAWADEQLSILGEVKFNQEVLAEFCGSSNTLITGHKLASLPFAQPNFLIPDSETLAQWEEPKPDTSYVMCVDVSRGANLDYSTFLIFDISQLPYKIVSRFRDNKISTHVFPELIMKFANAYNKAFVLIETNDLGQQVADTLYYDLEYENVYMSTKEEIEEGGGSRSEPGCRTTKKTKAIGCDFLKNLVENDKILINDYEIVSELSTFSRIKNSYSAESGKHDDLVMCLVMFSYLTTQPVFKDLFDFSLRERFFGEQIEKLEQQMMPLGFLNTGKDSDFIEPIIQEDLVWVDFEKYDDYLDRLWSQN